MKSEKFLGRRATDKLTKFTGIITGEATYITGCRQLFVLPKSDNPNTYKEGHWFDEGRLKLGQRVVEFDALQITDYPGCDTPPPKGE